MRKKIFSMLAATALVIGGLVLTSPASPALAAGSGDVQCFFGNSQVVGVWVEVSGGQSGYASRGADGYGGNWYSYSQIDAGMLHRLHVGCGGTPQNWGASFVTPWTTGYHNWICTSSYQCYLS